MPLSTYPSPSPARPDLSTQDSCPFFAIPPELRNRIYEDLLYVPTESKCIAIVHERETSGTPSVLRLLLTCRQVRDEAEGIFYNLNELYFDVGLLDLPNFHRFLRALSPRRRGFIKRINLDLATVESLASVLRLLERFSAIEILTLGFPRGHPCLQEGLLMRKLKLDGEAIKSAIVAMPALERVQVAVVGSRYRRQDHLVVAEAGRMQRCLQALVDRKNVVASVNGRTAETMRSVDAAALQDGSLTEQSIKIEERSPRMPSTSEDWPAQRYSNFYERFETPEPYG